MICIIVMLSLLHALLTFCLDFQEVKLEWGKGLAQKRQAAARALELEIEQDKPFARSR